MGLNSGAKKIILNDKQEAIIGLLKFLRSKNVESLLKEIQQIIIKYGLSDSKAKPKGFYKIVKNEGLSRHNKQGFLELRDNYNANKSSLLLFVLIIFGFLIIICDSTLMVHLMCLLAKWILQNRWSVKQGSL